MQKEKIIVTDKNREDILDNYCEYLLDNMDFQSLWEFAYNSIRDNKGLMSNKSLEDEILEYYPEILGGEDE
jgi:hypothetical protein